MQEGPPSGGPSWRERRGTCGLCAAGAAASAASARPAAATTEEHAAAARPSARLGSVAALSPGGLAAGALPAVGGDVLRGVAALAAGGLAPGAVAAASGGVGVAVVPSPRDVLLDDHIGLGVVSKLGLEVVGGQLQELAGPGVAPVVEDRRCRADADRRGQSHDRKSSAVHRSLLPLRPPTSSVPPVRWP